MSTRCELPELLALNLPISYGNIAEGGTNQQSAEAYGWRGRGWIAVASTVARGPPKGKKREGTQRADCQNEERGAGIERRR